MSRRYSPKKILILFWMFFVASVFLSAAAPAQQIDPAGPVVGGVTVEQAGEGEWRIINQDGQFIGILKSERQQSFTFYDASGVFMGTILESKEWFHRLYRKRDTSVKPEEARLYIDALKAIEIIKK